LINEHLILIVEDNDDDYNITMRALRKSGVDVGIERCEDGDMALDYLYHRGAFECPKTAPRPDIILLDLNLPGTDGKEVLLIIKADKKLMNIPVIVMTTSSDPVDIEKCYQYGANSYVQKPIGFNNYMMAVEQIKLFWLEVALMPKGEKYND
jgi:CheY-like chemotaxis protein